MKSDILSVKDLSKSYSEKPVISCFNYVFHPGCYAIVGPNGIGKSTLLSMIVGAIEPESGTILLNETPISHVKNKLSYVPDQAMIYPFLTGAEFLNLIICLKTGISEPCVKNLIQEFKVDNFLGIQIKDMSFGTQKKFFIIAALMNHPVLIAMDEPTNAIDPEARTSLITYLKQSKDRTIILFSTHDSQLISETQATQIHLHNKFNKENVCKHVPANLSRHKANKLH